MNSKPLLMILASTISFVASAGSKSPAELQQEAQLRAPSTTTRAAVLAEMARAQANGTLNVHPDYGTRAIGSNDGSTLTRAEVRAATAAAMANGARLSQGEKTR